MFTGIVQRVVEFIYVVVVLSYFFILYIYRTDKKVQVFELFRKSRRSRKSFDVAPLLGVYSDLLFLFRVFFADIGFHMRVKPYVRFRAAAEIDTRDLCIKYERVLRITRAQFYF